MNMRRVTVVEDYKIKIPCDIWKKMRIKPGDNLEILTGENKNCIIRKKDVSVSQETFGAWKNEIDGIEYMDKMRGRWVRQGA